VERALSPKALSYALLALGLAATVWFAAAPRHVLRRDEAVARENRPTNK
jgi:hypothetical protein